MKTAVAVLVTIAAVLGVIAPGSAAASTARPLGQMVTANDEVSPSADGQSGGRFGQSIAISSDGTTAVIGGPGDNSGVGAAWIFIRSGSTWVQQGPKLTSGTGETGFGARVAISGDGSTVLVSNGLSGPLVFVRSGTTWSQQGPQLAPDDATGTSSFGSSLALSSDGNTALVGGSGDAGGVGATWAFIRSGLTWSQQGPKLAPDDATGASAFGSSLGLSSDGNTVFVGGPQDNGGVGAGWAFVRSGTTWSQQGPKLTPTSEIGAGLFGSSVALSSDGNTVFVGGPQDNGGYGAGWAFVRSGTTWSQQGAKLTPTYQGAGDGTSAFGSDVALSGNGNTALIGGPGFQGGAGAFWVFGRVGSTWTQSGPATIQIKDAPFVEFATSVALSGDATDALIGDPSDHNVRFSGVGPGRAWDVAIDAIPPAPFDLLSPPNGAQNIADDPTFTWNSTSDASGIDHYVLTIDGTFAAWIAPSACNGGTCSATAPNPLSGGAHTWLVTAVDGAGNQRPSDTNSFTVDTTPPAAFSNVAPANGARFRNRKPTLQWSPSSDSGSGLAGYRVLLNGAQVGSNISPSATSYTLTTILPDGNDNWQIEAVDNVGNVTFGPVWTFSVDNAPPQAALKLRTTTPVTGVPATLDASSSSDPEGAPIIDYSWDPLGTGKFSTTTGSTPTYQYAYASPGTYHAAVQVTNSLGLTSTASVLVSVHPAPPPGPVGVTIDHGTSYTNNPQVTLNAVWPAGTDTIVVSNDGGFATAQRFPAEPDIPWTLATASAQTAPKTVYVRFGTSTQTYSDDIVLDTIAPVISKARGVASTNRYRLEISASDENSGLGTLQIATSQTSPGPLLAYTTRPTYQGTSPPQWVRVRDNAGNFSAWHAITFRAPREGVKLRNAVAIRPRGRSITIGHATNPPTVKTRQMLTAPPGGGASRASHKRTNKNHPIVIARGSTKIPSGKTVNLAVKLTPAGRRLLRGRHKLKATVTVIAIGPTGTAQRVKKLVTLRLQ
jgi:hypothetical protein